jgi:hypothetical protein
LARATLTHTDNEIVGVTNEQKMLSRKLARYCQFVAYATWKKRV